MKDKFVIHFDMDGVLVDYPTTGKPDSFLDLPPIDYMVDVFKALSSDDRFEVYIASTAPWSNPQSWMDKRLWCEKHLGEDVHKRIALTHNKQLLVGDVLIDDRPNNGAKDFKGCWVEFDKEVYDYDEVMDLIEGLYEYHIRLSPKISKPLTTIPMFPKTFPEISAKDLVGVQPMRAEVGEETFTINTTVSETRFPFLDLEKRYLKDRKFGEYMEALITPEEAKEVLTESDLLNNRLCDFYVYSDIACMSGCAGILAKNGEGKTVFKTVMIRS